jgi:hypothetical protein
LLLEKEMAWNLINVAAYIVPWISGIDSFKKKKKRGFAESHDFNSMVAAR